jgi:ethanolamine ammonia-lyase small subunit
MNPWRHLRTYTQARIGLGQKGASMPTEPLLALRTAEALAKDALFQPWQHEELGRVLDELGQVHLTLETAVTDRQSYLARPDWGRRLSDPSAQNLALSRKKLEEMCDTSLVFCVTDGLSAEAIQQHFAKFLRIFLPALGQEAFAAQRRFPFILLPFARIAAADHVGEILGSRLTVIWVGERPGLSAHDSMGMYLSYGPYRGKLDGERNCISNIRPPLGLSYELAAAQLCYLLRESLRRQLSGVDLKMAAEHELSLPAGDVQSVMGVLGKK